MELGELAEILEEERESVEVGNRELVLTRFVGHIPWGSDTEEVYRRTENQLISIGGNVVSLTGGGYISKVIYTPKGLPDTDQTNVRISAPQFMKLGRPKILAEKTYVSPKK